MSFPNTYEDFWKAQAQAASREAAECDTAVRQLLVAVRRLRVALVDERAMAEAELYALAEQIENGRG